MFELRKELYAVFLGYLGAFCAQPLGEVDNKVLVCFPPENLRVFEIGRGVVDLVSNIVVVSVVKVVDDILLPTENRKFG